MAQVLHSAPKFASNDGVLETLTGALGASVVAAREEYGEIATSGADTASVDMTPPYRSMVPVRRIFFCRSSTP